MNRPHEKNFADLRKFIKLKFARTSQEILKCDQCFGLIFFGQTPKTQKYIARTFEVKTPVTNINGIRNNSQKFVLNFTSNGAIV
ncbi:MAG: hypothetical protein LBT09_01435 [Planctomycetaceae bacterium]|nr:hypothetical protein [Planctomycetaceae bacterium]